MSAITLHIAVKRACILRPLVSDAHWLLFHQAHHVLCPSIGDREGPPCTREWTPVHGPAEHANPAHYETTGEILAALILGHPIRKLNEVLA